MHIFTLEIICKLACIAKFNNRVPNRKIQLFSKLPSVLNFKNSKVIQNCLPFI